MNDLQLKGYLPEDAYDTIRGLYEALSKGRITKYEFNFVFDPHASLQSVGRCP